jgi:hypothetical protein
MIIGRDNGNHETVRKTIASGRIFSTNMHDICRHSLCFFPLAWRVSPV